MILVYSAVLIKRFQNFTIEILCVKMLNFLTSNNSFRTCWADLSCILETSKSTTERLVESFCPLSAFSTRCLYIDTVESPLKDPLIKGHCTLDLSTRDTASGPKYYLPYSFHNRVLT